jgi:LEA14-like dessication related protein
VDNPNPVGMRLDALDFALFVNDNRIANGTTFDRVNIPARGIGNVRLRTHVTYDNLKSIYREVVDVVQGNRARYAIQGNATYDTPVGRMTLPVTIQR